MLAELDKILEEALAAIRGLDDEASLEEVRVGFLGKKGRLTVASAGMRDVAPELKKDVGQKLNEVRTAITSGLEEKSAALIARRDAAAFDSIDPTLPARPLQKGGLHPLTLVLDEAVKVLRRMGFALAEGPEI